MHMVPFKDLVAPFGCPRAYYFNSVRFSNAVEAHGVETVGIECLPNGRKGFRLTLCSGTNEFEVVLDNSRVKLMLNRMHQPQVTLAEGGAASENTWQRLAQIVKAMEDK
jgi:hypothetical protein